MIVYKTSLRRILSCRRESIDAASGDQFIAMP
jgi:hypothetical protein